MKVTQKQIDEFLQSKRLAMAGVSRNPRKFGHAVYRDLRKNGYQVLPIHPEAEMIHNTKCFKSVAELPSDIESLLIMTPKSATDDVLKEAFKKGIRNIWVQQMSETQETLKIAEREKKEIITGKCIYMFTHPVSGLHKFHRSISKIFGLLPK